MLGSGRAVGTDSSPAGFRYQTCFASKVKLAIQNIRIIKFLGMKICRSHGARAIHTHTHTKQCERECGRMCQVPNMHNIVAFTLFILWWDMTPQSTIMAHKGVRY